MATPTQQTLAKIAQGFRLAYTEINTKGPTAFHYQGVEIAAREVAKSLGLFRQETEEFLAECNVYKYMGKT